jgi:hypothetical protein
VLGFLHGFKDEIGSEEILLSMIDKKEKYIYVNPKCGYLGLN